MNRGEIWTASRAGRERLVVIVGHNALSESRPGVLVVPISDVRAATLIEPAVTDEDGKPVGVAMTPRVGEIDKTYLLGSTGRLSAESLEALNVALRAVLDL